MDYATSTLLYLSNIDQRNNKYQKHNGWWQIQLFHSQADIIWADCPVKAVFPFQLYLASLKTYACNTVLFL